MALPEWMIDDPRIRHVHHRDARPGVSLDFPDWVSSDVREALARVGVKRLWSHQVRAAEASFAGRHTMISTPTASGKSLGFLLPVIAATAEGVVGPHVPPPGPLIARRPHTALYLSPTKALAHDQLRRARELALSGWKVAAIDGDSDAVERRYAREFAGLLFSNPDMLHKSVLPNHARWASVLRSLRYVVIDEAHRYRGLFGAHVASVLRRLRRLCRHYGADPVFIAASGTVGSPGALLRTLTGVTEVTVVDQDGSARSELDFVLWEPDEDAHHEAATLLARIVDDGGQALAFTSSRLQAELVAERARTRLGLLSDLVASYRGGYLAEDRRQLERALSEGDLRGVACTNALELGVDITGMDAVVLCGFPGTLAALWQQAGRAGRTDRPALAVLVARPDPLDAYLCEHPELIFDTPVEATVLHPENPQILAAHLAAAAQELPITTQDAAVFGDTMVALADGLVSRGLLRRRGTSWYWTFPQRAVDSIDLRSAGAGAIAVVDAETGRVVGHVDPTAADRTVHDGAVYLHQGEQWLVESFDQSANAALSRRVRSGYFTQAQSTTNIRIVGSDQQRRVGAAQVHTGVVELTSLVTGYLRRDETTGNVWDSTPLVMPERNFRTRAVWWTLTADDCERAGVAAADLAGAAHAAEHAAIGLLPAFAPCDRWDIGGLSTSHHPDTGLLTVFIHDGLPGGAGFADQGFASAEDWLAATIRRLQSCECDTGCPRCVVSPKCGNGNNPLHKNGAIALLGMLVPHRAPLSVPA